LYLLYIAKASANFGLPATRPIYEKSIEVLPNRQAAQMCIRYAELEKKLGEIDRARAIYAHGSQFCDPRLEPKFWTEWHTFEIEHGSEDTFRYVIVVSIHHFSLNFKREYLRIRRSVQALYNTESSFLVAETLSGTKGAATASNEPVDPMAAVEKANTGFVKASVPTGLEPSVDDVSHFTSAPANADEIRIDD
jgi:pre-mRNA-splicing factor SYF1